MAQRLEDYFEEFNIEHSLRSYNHFVDALATLGSKVRFEGATTDVIIVKRPILVIQMLKEEFFDQLLGQTNWQSSIKEALLSLDEKDHLKVLKDYALMTGELYKKLLRGVLARCLSLGSINLPSKGHIWILVATEYFTKWVEAIPLKKATGPAVVNFIREHIICRFGIPHKILTDNGTPFVNKDVQKLWDHRHIKHCKPTPYYPQGNG
ncbi:uncharacterized protein LOC112021723 [Quercus suber]|uniref:uncharacterized protein LOC112021723 n=1 Tax=Quercus suber TaxID=58331 RepID=UPI000CE28742|nr:uncharacterized protein LOC112021723 [Quercus suber]